MKKLSIVIVYGGRSGEHEVSIRSATAVAAALDSNKYDVIPLHVRKNGAWTIDPSILPKSLRGTLKKGRRFLVPDASLHHLIDETGAKRERIDVVFPLVHGTTGEDGCLQGVLEMANLPYVGSGVLGSAVGMDKIIAKKLLKDAGIPVAQGIDFTATDWNQRRKEISALVVEKVGFPCFVKPANMGSSVGISKAHHRKEFFTAVDGAFRYDLQVLVERAVPKAREIECAVLGGESPVASVLGEIIPSNEFYDYSAKYSGSGSKEHVPADLPKAAAKRITDMALRAFTTLRAHGMARVDFLLSSQSRELIVNEINTLPGFTAISLYTKMQAASGVTYPALLDRLIALALGRHQAQSRLSRSYIHTPQKNGKKR